MDNKTKIGCKRTELKQYFLKRSKIKPVSKKRAKAMIPYNELTTKLRYICGDKSELSGDKGDWRTNFHVEPHHINGRNGNDLINPFNIIMLTRPEHDLEESHKTFERKQELTDFIKPIRIMQGFIPEDYE